MFILKKKATDFINKYFNLHVTGNEQDWDLELADANRLNEFLDNYNDDFTDDIKLALTALIFASYENYLHEHEADFQIEKRIHSTLTKDLDLFFGLLSYWSLNEEENKKNLFKITSFVRKFL